MSVHRSAGELVVRSVGAEFPLMEVLAEQMSFVVLNAFRPLSQAPHQPRVAIDRLVIHRESWTLVAADLDWPFIESEPERFRRVQA